MNISRLFIMRPVTTTLLMVALVVFGVMAYFALPVNDLPAVDYPTITVSASLAGANAETMASAVATPLEKQFTNIAGVDNMSSSSSLGSTSITLQFNLDRDVDGAAQDVQSAIIAARPFLPSGMPVPPTFRKVNPADAPILYISLNSPTLPLYSVDEYAENIIASRISMVTGVAQVTVYGSQIYAPHVQVDPRKLGAYGIGIDDVVNAVTAANVNLPTGTLYGRERAYNIMANGQMFNAAAYRPLVVAYKNGYPVRLQDLGNVIDSVQNERVASWFNKQRSIVLAIQRQPNTNTIQIVDSIKALLPQYRAFMPRSINLDVVYDRSHSIRRGVNDVKLTLLISVVLVVCVIFLFLGNASTTLIASLSLPVSIIGTFAVMKALNFSINQISLMALTLCVGFVVDDSIVVLENIVRYMEQGMSAMQASLRGSREIGFTIVSMTVSLIAVFIPILLMGGIVGRLFFEFAVTISVAIAISGFVSLCLTPMLCSRFLKSTDHENKHGLVAFADAIFSWMHDQYDRTLHMALDFKPVVMLLFVLMVAATGLLFSVMPKGFMPSEDTGQLNGQTECIQGISFEEMVRHQKAIADIIAKDPAVQGFTSSVGGAAGAANTGRFFIALKPMSERHIHVDQILQRLRKKTANIPGIKLYMQNTPAIRIGGMSTKSMYQFTLSGPDTATLYKYAPILQEKMSKLPGLQDVNTDMQMRNLQLDVEINRPKLAQTGVTMQQVQDALNSAYSTRQIGVIYTPTNQYWVICEIAPQYNNDPSMLGWLRIRSANGQLVALDTLATVKRTVGPQQINHVGQFPSVTLSFNTRPGFALNEAVDEVKELASRTLPDTITGSFQGQAKAFESSMQNLGMLLIVAVLVIYIILGILYESFIHPLTILSGLPSAGLGALIILMAAGKPLDIYGFLGLILLIGIVKKNAIMMIDFAVEYSREHDCTSREAITKACLVRFRPIMMTTAAALLGSVPIAVGFGQGSESRQPLGLAIVGGLLVSQLVTLYITPVFYIYLDSLQKFLNRKREKHILREETA